MFSPASKYFLASVYIKLLFFFFSCVSLAPFYSESQTLLNRCGHFISGSTEVFDPSHSVWVQPISLSAELAPSSTLLVVYQIANVIYFFASRLMHE